MQRRTVINYTNLCTI